VLSRGFSFELLNTRQLPCSSAGRLWVRRAWWCQGICVPGCCTICPSGRALANARVYWRVRGEEP